MNLLDQIKRLILHVRMNLGGIMLVAVFIITAYACLFTDVSIGRIVSFAVVGIACAFSLLFVG